MDLDPDNEKKSNINNDYIYHYPLFNHRLRSHFYASKITKKKPNITNYLILINIFLSKKLLESIAIMNKEECNGFICAYCYLKFIASRVDILLIPYDLLLSNVLRQNISL